MAREPFLPLFFGDFLSSTSEWEGEEQALYLLLLGHQWAIGSLPADPHKLCKLVRWDWELFSRFWPTVSQKFERFEAIADAIRNDGARHQSANGVRLQNARLEEHRAKAAELSGRNSAAGKLGAEARWGKKNGGPIASATKGDGARHKSANGLTPMAPSHPIPSSDSICAPSATVPRETNLTREEVTDAVVMELLGRIKAAYPKGIYRQSDWILTEREIRALLDEGQEPGAMFAGVERYAAQIRARGCEGTEFVLAPLRFFHERQFFEEFPLPKAEKRGPTRDEQERDELRKLMDRRPLMRPSIADFRDPNPGETAEQYRAAQDTEWRARQPRDVRAVAQQLAKSKAVA